MKAKVEPGVRRKEIGAVAGGSSAERLEARMELASVDLLERVLRRRRWSANDKDALAAFLKRLVLRELHAARLGKKEEGTP